MEAKKIYSLLFASWISRQTIGIIKSKSQGPRIRIANVGGHERDREKMNLFPAPPVCPLWALDRVDAAHLLWSGLSALLSSPIKVLISFRTTFTDSPRNNVLPAFTSIA